MSPDDKVNSADIDGFVSTTLSRLGFLVGETTLISAIQAFQQSRGLVVDGELNPMTLRSLEEARWRLGDRVLSLSLIHI